MEQITIRKAEPKDTASVMRLLEHILTLHSSGRPDIFKAGSRKYSQEEFYQILQDETKPVLVAVNAAGEVLGYAFCILKDCTGHPMLQDRRTLYIDDFCVGEAYRGHMIGTRLLEAVKELARQRGAVEIELNVWNFNKSAIAFYEHCGFTVQKSILELPL